MTLASLIAWINAAIVFGTVIMFGSVGEILTEKSGNLNLGVPGVMYLGGIASIAGAFFFENAFKCSGTFMSILAVLFALICGFAAAAFGGFIYSFLTITLRANQNVTGLTLTIFGSGIANFFGGSLVKLSGGVGQISVSFTSKAFRVKLPWLSEHLGDFGSIFFDYSWMAYLAVIVAILVQLFFTKTRVGLNLRAVGENPATADAAGINVIKYKYVSTILGCGICGLGGVFYVMCYIKGTWSNDGTIEALGWLAVALVIFTTWRPKNAIWGSYLFGLCFWLYVYMPTEISSTLAAKIGLAKSTYMQNIYKMLPYIVTIIVLIVASHKKKKENLGPASLGVSYFREER